jgi:hypothetical protein
LSNLLRAERREEASKKSVLMGTGHSDDRRGNGNEDGGWQR